ncbi:MAG: RsmE family RNA methyltransferase [Bacteroidota bacterium]|nr:RsmE family RNA methyltransferase [Bacteroidota bacterium]
MDYFYCPPENILKNSITIDSEEFSHLTHVMRKKVGDTIRVVDGMGNAFDVRLDAVNKKTAVGTILSTYKNHNELSVSITLAVGILKNPSKFDFLVEKVTELGVKEIIPLKTERTIPLHAKVDRWQKLALAAMKQSGRSLLPRVHELMSLDEFLHHKHTFDLKIAAHEKAESATPFQNLLPLNPQGGTSASPLSPNTIAILIGPEGGFSDQEVAQFVAGGYKIIYFGERRLRTETAAIVSAALLMLRREEKLEAV